MHVVPDGVEGREYNAEEVYLMFLCDSNDKGRLSIELSGKHADHAVDRHDVWMVITDETATREAWNKRIQKAILDCQGIVQQPSSIRKIREKLNQRSKWTGSKCFTFFFSMMNMIIVFCRQTGVFQRETIICLRTMLIRSEVLLMISGSAWIHLHL